MGLTDDLYGFMSAEDDRIQALLLKRFWWNIFEERGSYGALRPAPGTNRISTDDPRCTTLEQELRSKGYTDREILEHAVREVVNNIEEVYSGRGGIGTDVEDLTPHLEEQDLSPEGKEDLVQFLADFYEEEGRRFRESEAYQKMERRDAERQRAHGYVPRNV